MLVYFTLIENNWVQISFTKNIPFVVHDGSDDDNNDDAHDDNDDSNDDNDVDCYMKSFPYLYKGRTNVTADGEPCYNWKKIFGSTSSL